jgi:hypothetical protein
MAGGRVVPRSDEVIGRFFADLCGTAEGIRRERLERAEQDLRGFFEDHADLVLAGPELALLALERQFDPDGAAARVAEAEALLLLLPLFLEDQQWQDLDYEDRRLRIELADPLAHDIAVLPELQERDLGAAVWIVEATVRHAIWMLRQERAATRRS